jgi:hypothetical protein
MKLFENSLAPNDFDGSGSFIVQISCGVGQNSDNGPILSNALAQMLKRANYDYYCYKIKKGKMYG